MSCITNYWNLAGFETVVSPKNVIAKLVKAYQDQLKNKTKENKKSLDDREKFKEDLNKLFEISHSWRKLSARTESEVTSRGESLNICHSSKIRGVRGRWPWTSWTQSIVRRKMLN